MPIFKIDIEKRRGDEYWTNRYLVNIPAITDGQQEIDRLIGFERPLYYNTVSIVRTRIADLNPATDEFITTPRNLPGLRDATSPLPLFNVVRVDFPAGLGRPSRKYLRGILLEGDIEGDNLTAPITTVLLAATAALYNSEIPLVDPDGTPLAQGIPWPQVGMRQLRRGTRRRTTPVLP